MKKILFVFLTFTFFLSSFGQSLEKEWQFSSIENTSGESLFSINSEKDLFTLEKGSFEYTLEAKENLKENTQRANDSGRKKIVSSSPEKEPQSEYLIYFIGLLILSNIIFLVLYLKK